MNSTLTMHVRYKGVLIVKVITCVVSTSIKNIQGYSMDRIE